MANDSKTPNPAKPDGALRPQDSSANQNSQPSSETKHSKVPNKPIEKFVWKGVSASVFENYPAGKDVPYYKTQIVRTYRDEKGFKSVSTFSRDELTLVMKVAQNAWDFILDKERETRREKN